MLLLWKTPRLRVTCLQSTESCSVGDNFMCWWRFFQVALLPYHGRISSKVLCKFEVSTLLFLLENYRNLLSRYFTVFVFCNWSLLCLSFIDWFMEYCPVAWKRENTQVSVKPTSGQRGKRPPTQVSNAHVQMLWKSCSLSPCKEKAVSSSLQVAKSWMFYQDSSNWLNCSFFGLCLTRYNSKILLFLITSTVLEKAQLLDSREEGLQWVDVGCSRTSEE